MSSKLSSKILLLLGMALGALILFYFQSTILFIFLGIILALVINLPTAFLHRKGMPRTPALIIASIGSFLLVLTIFLIVIPALSAGVVALSKVLPDLLIQLSSFYNNLQLQYSFLPTLDSLAPESTDDSSVIKNIADILVTSLSNIGGIILDGLIVLLIAIFLLINPIEYRNVFLSLIPPKQKAKAEHVLKELKTNLETWIKTLGLSISVTFFLVWIALSLLGFPYAFVIALIAGVATFIPNVGAIIPIIPIIIFGVTSVNPILTIWAILIYVTIQVTEGNIITPSFMKASLSILPAGILVFQIIAAQVLGILGVLLAVPILVVIMILVRELYIKPINVRAE